MSLTIRDLLEFQKIKKVLEKNNFFLDTTSNEFVVGEKKYKTKWSGLLNTLGGGAPIGIFSSLEETRAFALGFSVGKQKKWKY